MAQEELRDKIDKPVFHLVGEAADSLGRECYVVGGYVRDLMLGRHSKDIDFLTVGSGIEVAQEVARTLKGSHLWNLWGHARKVTTETAVNRWLRTARSRMISHAAISPSMPWRFA